MQKTFTSTIIKAAYVLAFFLLGFSAKTNAQLSAGALSFDGVDDYVNVPSVNILNQLPLTIEAWVKPNLRTDGSTLTEFGNNVISNDLTSQFGTGFGAVVLSSNVSGIIVAYNDGFRYLSAPMSAGTWYHVSVVYTPGNVKTYLNGSLLESYNFSQNYTASSTLIRIGKYNDNTALGTKRFFKGDVDEVRVWNRALCQGEIMNNMNCEVSLPQNGLYSYYKFNVGLIGVLNSLSATLPDVSGNNNDGTLNNFALTGVLSNWVAGNASGSCNSFTVPPATITMGGSTTICQNDSVLMTANSANAYQWYNFGVAIPGETNQTYYAKQTGEYTVAVTTGSCTITSAVQNITVNPIPSIFINATSTSICGGIPVSMSLNGSNDAIKAASFNSVNSNDYVAIAHQSQLNPSAITIEAWVRPSQGGVDKGIIMKLPGSGSGQIGYGLRQTSANRFQFVIGSIGNEVFAQSAVQTIGPWYHLTGTYDGSVIRLYVNGSLAGSAVASGALTSTVPIVVGNSNTMNQPFQGTIDELRIWNNIKTSTQISCDYKIAADPTSSNLVGYWRMNTVSGTTTPDVTTYHNDGIIYNTTSLIASTASVGNTYKWEAAAGLTNLNNACVTITPTATTTFKGIATNSYGCSSKDSVTVTVFPSGQIFNVTGGGTYCIGGPGLPINLSGSQVGISYQLKKGAVNVGSLVAGTGAPLTIGLATETGSYTVIAVNNNCTNTMSGSAIVTAVSTPEINLISTTNPHCNGDSTGAIDLNVSGGTSPRTYTWSNNATSEDLSNVPAGTYTLNVTDINGCKDADTFTLTQPTAVIGNAVVSNVTCNGLTNGSISLTNGGTAPYIYTWSNNATTKDIINLAPGTYQVSVEDAIGCTSTKTYTVAQPGVLSTTLTPLNISCGGSLDGAVNLAVNGGTSPYTYQWSNNATTQNISGLAAGSYSVVVTDAHGCNAGASATVTQGVALTVNGTATDITCFGANNGSIQLTPVTGIAPYSYLWNNNSTAQNRNNLAPGTYSVTVTDSRNCTIAANYNISQSASALTTSVTHTNVLCNNTNTGAVDLTVNGGTAPYIYTWSNNATTQDLTAIPAGTYSVTVKDAKNCIVTNAATVSQPSALQVSAIINKAYCGNPTGDVDMTVSGGVTPYTYSWSNNATSQDLINVVAGNYSVTITDANGCSANSSYVIADSSSMSLSGTATAPICNGQSTGSIAIAINGGVAPFSYAWNDNATTQNRSQLAGGNYSVVVTDDGGCSVSGSFTVQQPAPITIVGDVLDASCNAGSDEGSSTYDGAIYLNLNGGTAPYSFVWTDTAYYDNTQDIEFIGAGTYHVTVTDNNGCTSSESFVVTEPALINVAATVTSVGCNNNLGAITTVVTGGNAPYSLEWGNNATSQNISGLSAGAYTLTVTDDWGCIHSDTFQVSQDALTLSYTVTNPTCNNASNGAIDVTANSTSTPVTYSWSNNATTQDLNNIAAGTYTLSATNATGCTATLIATVQQPAAIVPVATATNTTCNSQTGSVSLSVSGGATPYTYHWNNNATTKDISGIAAGTYNVTITDANGCSTTATATVGQSSASITATANATNATCGNSNGTIALTVNGGTAPYTYLWSNNATSQNLTALSAGTYNVMVIDANGCGATTSATVGQTVSNITATATVTNTTCGNNNGVINLAVSGGTAPYTYNWGNNITTPNLSNLTPGTYSVTVTDANGCTKTATANIGQSQPISITAATVNAACGNNNGSVNLTVNNATSPVSYAWSNNATSQNLANIAAGNYAVTVTDANNCTATGTYTIISFDTTAPVIAGPVSGSTTTQNPTAPALGFNVFVQNNASLAGSQTEGAVAMGGNLTLAGNYTVSANSAGTFQVSNIPVSLVIGGLVNYQGSNTMQVNQNGYVKIGDSTNSKVWYKDQNNAYSPIRITNGNSYNSSSRINMQANAQQLGNVSSTSNPVFQSNVIDFATAFTQMKASATGIGAMTDNASLTNANGNPIAHTNLPTQVKINLASGTNVLNLNASDLNAVQNFTYNQQPASNRILVINVNAPGSFAWNVWNSGGIGSSNSPYIIYNFYNTTALTVQGNGSVYGTLFAPYANINKTNSQNIVGQIIGQSYTKTGGSDLNSNFAATITSGTSTTIAANSTVNRNTSTTACSYTVSGTEFNATATDNCGTPTVNYVLTGATTGNGTNLSGTALNKGTTTITWNATDGTNNSSYSFNVTVADTVKPVAIAQNITVSLDANGNAAITPQSVDNGSYDNCSNITYALSQANFNATNLGANTVTLTITDGSNNTSTATAIVTVIDNSAPVIACPSNATIGCSANATSAKTGIATATDNTGTPVITYADIINGNTITRTWKATDASNNMSTCTQTITIVPVAATAVATNIACNGAANGAIALTINGGIAPYTYNWGNNITTQNRGNLSAGTYNVTITDATGCTATATATITEPSVLNATATTTNTICNANSGTITLSVSGGTAPYTYNWGNNITTQNRTSLAVGTYTVTVTDAKGCTKTLNTTINQSTTNITVTPTAVNATCSANNGSVTLAISGGTAPYTYLWSNNATMQNLSNIGGGTYSVTVTDANGCTKTASATVNQSTANITATTTVTNASCSSNTGSITLAVSGGTAPYTYLWNNNATTQNLSNLSGGAYSVTITDANGCTKTASATVNQSTANITVTGTATNVTCNGGNNGAVNLTISGGTTPYTYSWTGGATSKNISGKIAGTYTVVVTDANGCSKAATFTITQPNAIVLSAVATNVSCHGNGNGSIDLSVNGGTAPYTYNWNLGSNNNSSYTWWWWWWCNSNNNNNTASTQDVSGLDAGSYSVTVTDANGCTATGSYTITEPSTLSVNVSKTNVSCKDGNNGTITLNVNGGTAPYTYSWSNNATTQNLNNLTAGSYSVTITDANGCTENATVNIYQPNNGISANANITNVTCKGSSTGHINLSVSGGSYPYTYSWTGGATTQDLHNKAAGTYTVLITDGNGCSISKTYTVTEPATALSLSAVISNVSCKNGDNGAIDLSVTGGAGPYTYNWNLGSSNNNNNNCYNWWWWWCNSNCNNNYNSSNTQDVNGLEEGNYSVTVTDANGCSVSATYTITEPATAVTVNVSKTNVTCKNGNNGTITLSVSGGVAPYTYNWGSNITTQNRNNLTAGNYNVTVTDANGCTKTVSTTITQPSTGINITGTVTNVSCNNGNNGAVNVSVSGGSSPYSYSWTGGATTQDISNKGAGIYTVNVTDANGCSDNKVFTITEPSAITASIGVSPTVTVTNGQPYTIYNGYGSQSVTLSVSTSGGNGGYSYSWSPASSCSNSHVSNPTVSPNSTTTYTVTITDNKGCTKTVSKTINVIDATCGNNNNKVIVCHNGNEICVSQNAVQSHLNHGCSVGPCSNNAKGGSVIDEEDNNEETGVQALVGKFIRVYPNPSKGIFVLELPDGAKNASVLITDVSGRIIERRVVMGENAISFNLSKVAQGMYMIQVAIGNERYQSRITIE
jgi:hypothetical protein